MKRLVGLLSLNSKCALMVVTGLIGVRVGVCIDIVVVAIVGNCCVIDMSYLIDL